MVRVSVEGQTYLIDEQSYYGGIFMLPNKKIVIIYCWIANSPPLPNGVFIIHTFVDFNNDAVFISQKIGYSLATKTFPSNEDIVLIEGFRQ